MVVVDDVTDDMDNEDNDVISVFTFGGLLPGFPGKYMDSPVSVCSELELCGITTGGGLFFGVVILGVTSFGVREVGVVGLWLLPPTTPAYPEMGGGVTGGLTSFVE